MEDIQAEKLGSDNIFEAFSGDFVLRKIEFI